MKLEIHDLKVPIWFNERGVPRIEGCNVNLEIVLRSYLRKDSPEDIVDQYDTLTLANVYAVIAYYLQYQSEMDEWLREQEAIGNAIEREMRARYPQDGLKEKLLARRAAKEQAAKEKSDALLPVG